MYIKYDNLEDVFAKRLDDLFGLKDCLIEVNPGKCILPPKYKDLGERILNMEVRPDDVWLVSYPRTGKNVFTFLVIRFRIINSNVRARARMTRRFFFL